ncbi:ferrous iron transport protein B [Dubosiella newyorkensis]|uniref:ferrous iron transport protein B n=1 Tax=Dubosiella newyorkensis TaxID=1862672 RepID=UPI00255AA6E0|nr:ferrous iron transport protein B [Dubosiella newyorkensis]
MKKEITVAFIGNPNCGKTTLFNAYTGANLKVANWPGVTVERMEGAIEDHGHKIKLVDLPGTYSLTSYTMEESVSRDFIVSDEVDVIVDVVDTSSLERSLYLTLQLLELNKPVVIAANMMDIVEKRGIDLDLHRLSEILGVPCVPVVARKKKGLKALMHAALHQAEESNAINHQPMEIERDIVRDHAMIYTSDIEEKIGQVEDQIPLEADRNRWIAIGLLENDEVLQQKYPLDLKKIAGESISDRIVNEKYDYIERIMHEVLLGKESKEDLTDKIDSYLTHPIFGILFFFLIMALVFMLTFTIGDYISGYLETLIEMFNDAIHNFLLQIHVSDWLISLVCDGIISGVGGIITFLPNITILFIALAFLEDSGYMARVAYVMNGIMGKLGLSGRAFIPMVLGFGCTVPAIMASRTLESMKDRRRVMLITPFMSCSAKLPTYILLSGMFFQEHAMWVAYSMYLIGILVALAVAFISSKIEKAKEYKPLLIELPIYKMPSLHTVYVYVWEKVKDFLQKAGTTIFIASIVLWVLLNFGIHGYSSDISSSFAAMIGKTITPVLVPVGLGFWQIAVALLAGISAKEVVVSSLGVLFGISDLNSVSAEGGMQQALLMIGFNSLNAYCMMLFVLLYIPCFASLATIKKESGSSLYMWKAAAFQLAIAWLITFIFYQIARLFWV